MSTVQYFDTLEQLQGHLQEKYEVEFLRYMDDGDAAWYVCWKEPWPGAVYTRDLLDALMTLFYHTGIRVQCEEESNMRAWEVRYFPPAAEDVPKAEKEAAQRIFTSHQNQIRGITS